jgi:hypothetical protein
VLSTDIEVASPDQGLVAFRHLQRLLASREATNYIGHTLHAGGAFGKPRPLLSHAWRVGALTVHSVNRQLCRKSLNE